MLLRPIEQWLQSPYLRDRLTSSFTYHLFPKELSMAKTSLAYIKQHLDIAGDFRAEWTSLSDEEKADLKEAAEVEMTQNNEWVTGATAA